MACGYGRTCPAHSDGSRFGCGRTRILLDLPDGGGLFALSALPRSNCLMTWPVALQPCNCNPVEPLSARQLCRVVRAAAQAAGIAKRVSPHTLRHSFATHLLQQGVDIRVIQTLLGHAKLDTTALYTRVANTTIRAVTSPLDRLAPLIEGRPLPEA